MWRGVGGSVNSNVSGATKISRATSIRTETEDLSLNKFCPSPFIMNRFGDVDEKIHSLFPGSKGSKGNLISILNIGKLLPPLAVICACNQRRIC